MAEKPQKLSQLPEILADEIDGGDLLLVSDNDASGGCVSKKMLMAQLVKYIGDMLASQGAIAEIAQTAAENAVNKIVKDEIQETTMQTVKGNIVDIADLLDGKLDKQIYIDAGNSQTDGNSIHY